MFIQCSTLRVSLRPLRGFEPLDPASLKKATKALENSNKLVKSSSSAADRIEKYISQKFPLGKEDSSICVLINAYEEFCKRSVSILESKKKPSKKDLPTICFIKQRFKVVLIKKERYEKMLNITKFFGEAHDTFINSRNGIFSHLNANVFYKEFLAK